ACSAPLVMSQEGILSGVVTDGGLNEPLAFANVLIGEVNLGSTTELDGVYRIPNVPAGTFSVTFSYLGYESLTQEVTISAGEETELNVVLSQGGVTMDEVVVRGQATGQRAAINQQINSNTIVNVVSKEKLQELPDQNAAEAVGRLAGVSVYRDAGEGQRVSVRGISPRFNAITVNGERLPSTQESDRSVDLSMISPDMLAGIELFKAITPDMDGDAIGGTVNFTVAKADEGLRLQGRLLTGYNDLRQDFGQYRGNFSVSNRFLDGKMGIIATGNYQHANRSNEFIITDFVYQGIDVNDVPILSVENYNLGDKLETRNRYGGSLTLDYTISKDHTFLFNSSVGRTDRDEIRYRRRYRIGNNYQEFDINARQRKITLFANSLSGEHHFGAFDVNWRTSYSSSDQNTPEELRGRFREIGAIGDQIQDETNINSVASAYKHALDNTIFYDSRFNKTKVNEDRLTGQLDLRYNFNLGKKVNGFFKTGIKYRSVDRDRVRSGVIIRPYLVGNNPAVDDPEKFLQARGGQILMANFLGDYTNPDFYDGLYDILPATSAIRGEYATPVEGVDINAYNNLFGTNYQLGDQINYGGHIDINKIQSFYDAYRGDYQDDPFINSGDYNGKESILGSYLMGSLNLGKKITVLGGARYEQTDQDYTSFRIVGDQIDPDDPLAQIDAKTITRSEGKVYDEILPMFHFKYKAAAWMDVRLAATKTLARPNFFNIVPYEFINTSESMLQYGNPQLLHTTAWNYDAFLSFYNKFGLFTIGGFYKELRNIDFIANITITDPEDMFKGFALTEPRNITGISTVKGVEFDFQTNLSSLPGFLSGIVFSANLTVSSSKTFYPLFNVETVFVGPPVFFETIVTDTLRGGPVVGQADLLSNITLGYERGGFSGRVSMIYQSDALSPGNPGIGSTQSGVGEIPETDFFDQGFFRFDLAIKQKLTKKGNWTLMFNLNNFTNTPERAFLGIADRLRDEEFYGMTADLGIAFKIK
ncbi:MAG: TonB-dependent receptor, partial [Saprospiraceae bacterium]|nr:TonB-dependent receptor [Saprospiraceae bacterium]